MSDSDIPANARRRVTSADVAAASGVSRATVSYVLNDAPGRSISAKTRARVLQAAESLGHIPFAPARSLRLGRSDIVLALTRDYGLGYISNRVLHDLDIALAERGYLMLVHRFDSDVRSIPELGRQVTPALVVAMGGLDVPDVSAFELSTDVYRVHGTPRQERAGRMQIEHLAARGHRRIGYAYPPAAPVRLIAEARLAGSRQAVASLELAAMDQQDVDVNVPETVRAAVRHWLEADEPVTAIACHNDEIALLVMAALMEAGLVIGSDIAVIGIDDIPAARISLTTVRIDADAWSDAVIDRVVRVLDTGEHRPIDDDFLALVERGSA